MTALAALVGVARAFIAYAIVRVVIPIRIIHNSFKIADLLSAKGGPQ